MKILDNLFPFDFKIISEVECVVMCLVVIVFYVFSVQIEDLNIFSVNCSFSYRLSLGLESVLIDVNIVIY